MGQVIELVFEGMDIGKARELAIFVISCSRGVVDMTVDTAVAQSEAPQSIPSSFDSLFIRLKALCFSEGVEVPNVGIRSFRYDSQYDLEINVDLDDVENMERLVDVTFEFAQGAAAVLGIENYFAGLEPASDVDTRLFTMSARGPLHLPKTPGAS